MRPIRPRYPTCHAPQGQELRATWSAPPAPNTSASPAKPALYTASATIAGTDTLHDLAVLQLQLQPEAEQQLAAAAQQPVPVSVGGRPAEQQQQGGGSGAGGGGLAPALPAVCLPPPVVLGSSADLKVVLPCGRAGGGGQEAGQRCAEGSGGWWCLRTVRGSVLGSAVHDCSAGCRVERTCPGTCTRHPRPNATTSAPGGLCGLQVGQSVYAMGYPYGYGRPTRTLSVGLVSGLDRAIPSPVGARIYGVIQVGAQRGGQGGRGTRAGVEMGARA